MNWNTYICRDKQNKIQKPMQEINFFSPESKCHL